MKRFDSHFTDKRQYLDLNCYVQVNGYHVLIQNMYVRVRVWWTTKSYQLYFWKEILAIINIISKTALKWSGVYFSYFSLSIHSVVNIHINVVVAMSGIWFVISFASFWLLSVFKRKYPSHRGEMQNWIGHKKAPSKRIKIYSILFINIPIHCKRWHSSPHIVALWLKVTMYILTNLWEYKCFMFLRK